MALQPIVITSLSDPRVDVYRNVRDADLRGRDDLFMAESELVIRRLIRTPQRLHSLLLSPEKFARLQNELESREIGVPVYVAELGLMHDIAAFHIHRGVLAAGYRSHAQQMSLDGSLGHLRQTAAKLRLLATEGITNVDNMGALFRNAAAFGVDGIVLDQTCCDPLYRKAIRVSMGHVLSIPYAVSNDWDRDLLRLKQEWGVTLIGAEIDEKAVPLWRMPRHSRVGIIFGSEGHGLSQRTIERCDAVCQIPMADGVPSINVAVASAVFLYELTRSNAIGDS